MRGQRPGLLVGGLLLGLLLGLGPGCAPDPTQALVSIDLDPSLLDDLTMLVVFVDGPDGDGGSQTVHQTPMPADDTLELPFVLSLVPAGGDASRIWSVEAQAIPMAPSTATVARLEIGTYREHAVTRYELVVRPCGTPCASAVYCLNGACVPGPPRME